MIYLKERHIDEMIAHAKLEYPKEACGILAGRRKRVEVIYKMSNIDESSTSYFANSQQQFNIMREIETSGLKMYGIYHSHPNASAYPSKRDIELALYPDSLYFIISLKDLNNPVVKAYWIRDGKVEDGDIQILEEEDGEDI